MSKLPESQAEKLARTSEIYRRMRAEVQPPSLAGQATAEQERLFQPAPPHPVHLRSNIPPSPAPLPAAPVTVEPDFVRRLLTRRPDRRELVLLAVVAVAVLYSIQPF
ncbi:hypothetical protein L0V05_19195 [Tabrizicola sp. J26]|uniref:hypothetical protein n=1 Tax=Alitabrizicola rongguiensis TaxID=2909234 RepID=UPI001F15E7FD|nr:hypothetical protein [Tabrizicola rongguiensis]MCF1710940.1 hypothetical protein [Tabrizicola rongguiensis]